ncbi:MAG TPA: hypothetical protein VKX46_17700, partial [Ktedonobacteraceae bacterium]|nr:hypothetical protein [Ktedonobacteraceae bacterium]
FLLFWPNQKPFERFHAVQATLLSLFYGILSTLFLLTSRTHPRLGDGALSLLNLVMIILTVIMIISALLGKTARLPMLGNIARAFSEKKPLYNQQQLNAVPGSTSIAPVHIPSRVRILAALSYLFFFVSGLIGLLRARKNRFIRFHALQSLCFFTLMLVCLYLASAFPVFLLPIAAAWLSGMIAACSGTYYRMPLVGTFVARMIARDRTLQ